MTSMTSCFAAKQLLRRLTAPGQDLFYYSKRVVSQARVSKHNIDLKLNIKYRALQNQVHVILHIEAQVD